jgi:hypothetical protein
MATEVVRNIGVLKDGTPIHGVLQKHEGSDWVTSGHFADDKGTKHDLADVDWHPSLGWEAERAAQDIPEEYDRIAKGREALRAVQSSMRGECQDCINNTNLFTGCRVDGIHSGKSHCATEECGGGRCLYP